MSIVVDIIWSTHSRVLPAVERIKEYLQLDQEAPAKVARPPPAGWPSSGGGIDVENLVVRYAPHLPAVLKGISFSIRPHEKVGIVRDLFISVGILDSIVPFEGRTNGLWEGASRCYRH